MDIEEVFSGVVTLFFVIILGWAFTQVFLSFPGGFGWTLLFLISIGVVIIGIIIAILKAIGGD